MRTVSISATTYFLATLIVTFSHAATLRGTTASNKMNREHLSFRVSNTLNTNNYPLLDTLSMSFIERAAQKYDCSTGEKDIDAILDEVTASNKHRA